MSAKSPTRAPGGWGAKLIDGGPYDMGELAEMFATLDTKELAGGWVGCVVDSFMSLGPPKLGALSRALNVVATRLHGQSFKGPIMDQQHTASTPPVKAKPASGFIVVDGTPPAPKAGGGRFSPVTEAARALKPGQYIAVDPTKYKRSAITGIVNKLRKEGMKHMHSYIASDGQIIVIHERRA